MGSKTTLVVPLNRSNKLYFTNGFLFVMSTENAFPWLFSHVSAFLDREKRRCLRSRAPTQLCETCTTGRGPGGPLGSVHVCLNFVWFIDKEHQWGFDGKLIAANGHTGCARHIWQQTRPSPTLRRLQL